MSARANIQGTTKGGPVNFTRLARVAGLAAAIVLVGACSGGGAGPTNAPAGSTGGGGGGSTTGSGGGGGGGGTGADAGTLNACNLLTTDEIGAVTALHVAAGVVQNSDGQSDCTWNSADGSAVGLTISNYDDSLWQAGSSAGNSTAVPAIGDAAFKGWPHAGDLTIKFKNYQVAVTVVDFKMAAATIDQANLMLARIVLPRL